MSPALIFWIIFSIEMRRIIAADGGIHEVAFRTELMALLAKLGPTTTKAALVPPAAPTVRHGQRKLLTQHSSCSLLARRPPVGNKPDPRAKFDALSAVDQAVLPSQRALGHGDWTGGRAEIRPGPERGRA
jgi:hypothetical protein